MPACCGSAWAWPWRRRCCSRLYRACRRPRRLAASDFRAEASASRRARTVVCGCLPVVQIAASFVRAGGRRDAVDDAHRVATHPDRLRDAAGARGQRPGDARRPDARSDPRVLPGHDAAGRAIARRRARLAGYLGALAGWTRLVRLSVLGGASPTDGEDHRGPAGAPPRRGFSPRSTVPIVAGRDSTDDDGRSSDDLVIVSQSLARRHFPSVEAAVNRRLAWTDSNLRQFGGVSGKPRRIVGVAAAPARWRLLLWRHCPGYFRCPSMSHFAGGLASCGRL